MRIELLGPLRVQDDAGTSIELAGARLRGLLIRLAVDAPAAVSPSALIDALWGDEPPADQANALQSLVSRLRRGLRAPDAVVQTTAGYRLNVASDDVDLNRFGALVRSGRESLQAGDPQTGARVLGDALALWHGSVAEGWGDTVESAAYQARLSDQLLEATVDHLDAELTLGHPGDAIATLEDLLSQHPLRERLTVLLMRALADTGRQAEALTRYELVRRQLADELGVDPSAELQAAHLAVLRGEHSRPALPAAAPRSNIKTALTSFVGRDEEVAKIGKLLDEVRLVTLVGPGGAGKTRLATVAVTAILERIPDGVWLTELAPVTDPADVPSAVLDALGLRDATLVDRNRTTAAPTRDPLGRLIDVLTGRTCVLVFDNCEHVIDAAARLADDLLAQCPDLRIVTTSREPLGIVGESLVAVPPLSQPVAGSSPATALDHPAVRLFADRAAAVAPQFVVDVDTVGPVIEIVRRLDGLPLAIELAAARLRSLPVDEISERLSDRFRLLTGGSRTAMPRHRTLRAVVEWSWDLLSEPERLLAERLAVFAGEIAPSEAIAVCGDEQLAGSAIDDLLVSLVDRSLLQVITLDGSRRHRMLETIREYGLERLGERGEVGTMRRAHAARFAALVGEAAPHSRGSDQLVWMAILESERENILAALRFICDDGQAQLALAMATELGVYWMFSGRNTDVAMWLALALNVPGDADVATRLAAESLYALGTVASDRGRESGEIETDLSALRALSTRLDGVDVPDNSLLLLLRPVIATFADDSEHVAQFVEAGLKSSDPWIAASVRMFRASMAENTGELMEMRADAEVALAEFREIGERWGIASCLGVLAQIKTMESDLDGAVADLEEALLLTEQLAGHDDAMMLNLRLADLRMRTGDATRARESIDRMREVADMSTTSHQSVIAHIALADIAREEGDLDEARRLGEASLATLRQLPAVHPAQGHVASMVIGFAAKISIADGLLETAHEQLVEAFRYARGTKDQPIIATVGVVQALYLAVSGRPDDAARVLGAAARLRGSDDPTQPGIASLTQRLREALGDRGFEKAFRAGRGLDVAAALDCIDPAQSE